jgi:hypothetical protein
MAVSSWGINSPSSALACRNQAGSDIFTDDPQIQPARPVDGENGTTKYAEGAKRETRQCLRMKATGYQL